VTLALGCGGEASAAAERTIALLSPQDRVGDALAVSALDQTLRFELSRLGRLVGPEPTRNARRRLRLRNADSAAPAALRALSDELGADWLVSVTLHEAERGEAPRAAVSARIYAVPGGEMLWAGFEGASALDGVHLLGLNTITELERLVTAVTRQLLSEDALSGADLKRPPASESRLGRVAILPFAGATEQRASAAAQTVTEAIRAHLWNQGVASISPNVSEQILRRVRGAWGGVSAEARAALHDVAGADSILTGTVETLDTSQQPRVAVAARLLSAASGRIVWTGWVERDEARARILGLGRLHSPASLAGRVVEDLVQRLVREATLEKEQARP
jgi:TolB-like protein